MSDIQKVIVVGGGGTLGKYIVQSLIAAEFSVTILSRPTSQSKFLDGVEVISAVGVQGIMDQVAMIDAAKAVGVKRFVLGEFANAPEQKRLPDLEFARKSKKEVLKYAMEKAAANRDFTWSALAVGSFIDWAIEKFPAMGFTIPSRAARIYDDGNEPITGTTIASIGRAVAGILQRPAATANRLLRTRSLQVTQNEILAAFEEATGEKWSVTKVKSKDVLAEGRRKLAVGDRGGMLDLLTVQLFEEGAGRSIVATKEDSDNELLGVPEEGLSTVIKAILGSA